MIKHADTGGRKAKFCRYRQISPKRCSPKSFRVKKINKGTRVVICCPKGHYSRGRCRVGTMSQSILRRKKRSGSCPRA